MSRPFLGFQSMDDETGRELKNYTRRLLKNNTGSGGWSSHHLVPVVQGASGSNRIGIKVWLRHLVLRAALIANQDPSIELTAAQIKGLSGVCRVLILIDHQPKLDGFTVDPDDVLEVADDFAEEALSFLYAPYNQGNLDRFTILSDDCVALNNVLALAENSAAFDRYVGIAHHRCFFKEFTFGRKELMITYKDATSHVNSNSVQLLVIFPHSTADNPVRYELFGSTQAIYVDH